MKHNHFLKVALVSAIFVSLIVFTSCHSDNQPKNTEGNKPVKGGIVNFNKNKT